MTDVPLPVPIAEMIAAAVLAPPPGDRMLAVGAEVIQNATDAAAAYPDLWPNREAAKKALWRGRLGTYSHKELSMGECPQPLPGLRRVEYQRAGAGRSRSVAWHDPILIADPMAWLTDRLGPLAWCPAPPNNLAASTALGTPTLRQQIRPAGIAPAGPGPA